MPIYPLSPPPKVPPRGHIFQNDNSKALLTWNFNFVLIYSKKIYFFQKNNQNWHLSIIMHYIGNNSKIGVSAMENRLRGIIICYRCLNKVSYQFPITYLTFPSETMLKYFKFVNICPHMWFEVSAQPPFLGVISRFIISYWFLWLQFYVTSQTSQYISRRYKVNFYYHMVVTIYQNESYYIWLGRFSHNNLYNYRHKFPRGILQLFYQHSLWEIIILTFLHTMGKACHFGQNAWLAYN